MADLTDEIRVLVRWMFDEGLYDLQYIPPGRGEAPGGNASGPNLYGHGVRFEAASFFEAEAEYVRAVLDVARARPAGDEGVSFTSGHGEVSIRVEPGMVSVRRVEGGWEAIYGPRDGGSPLKK